MGLLDLAKKGFQSKVSGYGVGRFYGSSLGEGLNWNREAGVRYDNSVVFAAIAYACNAMSEVDVYVRRLTGKSWEEVPNHEATLLLRDPNPWYDWATYLSGCIISELAGRAGMSYTYKHRSGAGKLIGLEYIPHFAIFPYASPGSGNFIDNFRVTVPGGYLQVAPENILQQRFGPLNPMMPQISLGPLEAALLEVVTDKQAANYTASLLKNVGVTPHLISPALKDMGGTEIIFGEVQIKQIQSAFEEKITGDNRGRPLIAPLPIKVDDLSFSPEDMNLEAIRNVAEERICAVLRIPPLTLNLGTGLQNTNNRASAEAAARQAARDFVKPYMQRKGLQFTRDLRNELLEPGEEIVFRTEALEALQDDKTETAKRDTLACGGAWETVNEVRERNGKQKLEGEEYDEVRNTAPAVDENLPEQDGAAGQGALLKSRKPKGK